MRIFFSITLCLFFTFEVSGQKIDTAALPENVRIAFGVMFKETKNQKWNLVNNEYICRFTKQGKKFKITFSPQGQWLMTISPLKKKDIQPELMEFIKKSDYSKYRIYRIDHVETNRPSKSLRVGLKKNKNKVYMYYDEKGVRVDTK